MTYSYHPHARRELDDASDSVERPVDDFSDDDDFWLQASEASLDSIWGNVDDDIYSELLEC